MIKIKKDIFKKDYYEKTNKQLVEKYGVSEMTIINYAKKFNLKLKGKGFWKRKLQIIN